MPIEAKVEEAIKKNNGVIPMEVCYNYDDGYVLTHDGVKIDPEQLRLLFWKYAKDDMSQDALDKHLADTNTLNLVVFANFARAFWFRDHAHDFETITEGRKFCETLAMQILVHSDVRIAMANKMHDDAMNIWRTLDRRLTNVALTTPET